MNRLRNRLIVIFLAATLIPLAATWWIAASLLEHSLSYSDTGRIDRLSRTLELTGRELYQQACDSLQKDARSLRVPPRIYKISQEKDWPADVRQFWESKEPGRFALPEDGGNVLQYLARGSEGVRLYERPLQFSMARLAGEYRQAREDVDRASGRDLKRGLLVTFAVLATAIWAASLAMVIAMAHRISRPIQQLTAGLAGLAEGDLATRLETHRDDEVGRAIRAFNDTAAQLEQSRERLVHLTQMASWQVLARKTAHELKNSLTPIRLTMEEVIARKSSTDRHFIEQAARIVVEEVESLERRVRAFSDFASEPPARLETVDVNATLEERIALLEAAHPGVKYSTRTEAGALAALADEDLLKGILTNLLENAADAAGPGGSVLAFTSVSDGSIAIEIHDSGSGLTPEARRTLFEPAISFKKGGMGLGLSIARKNALAMGGDILLVAGELGGAAFRVVLPRASVREAVAMDAVS